MSVKNANEVIADSYVTIAKYVAKERAFPSIIDGMKAVYRRMLFASKDFKGKVKSTEITAATMRYHNHADAYGVLVNMTCPYGNLPLYKGYGNFGGLSFGAASSRYTAVQLTDIAKLLYLDLSEYSNYIEGDSGLMEPDYLPALIPYALISGSSGMTVGLPTPEIPSFNLMDLIDFFQCKLNGCKINHYPRIDVGNVIIDAESSDDLNELYFNGKQQIWFKPVLTKSEDSVIVTEIPPNGKLHLAHKKLKWYIENEIIDYSDETDENGYKYVYQIIDKSKYSVDDLYNCLNKYLSSKITYRMYFEHESSVYLCSFDFIASKVIKNLRDCAIRKFTAESEKANYKIQVMRAIKKLRDSKELKRINKESSEYFIDLIKSWDFTEQVAKDVMSKSISYLTNSHDEEIEKLENNYKYLIEMKEDPTSYLSNLYDRLRDSVSEFYNSRLHSRYRSEIIDSDSIGIVIDDNNYSVRTDLISNGAIKFNGYVIQQSKITGELKKVFIGKQLGIVKDLESESLISSIDDDSKFCVTIVDYKHISVVPVDWISSNYCLSKLKIWDEYRPHFIKVCNSDEVEFVDDRKVKLKINLNDYVKKKISNPIKITYGEHKVISFDGKKV